MSRPDETSYLSETDKPQILDATGGRSLLKAFEVKIIAKMMRDTARLEKCSSEVSDLSKCYSTGSMLSVVKCEKESAALQDCIHKWCQNAEFYERCKNEYLEERSNAKKQGAASEIQAVPTK